MTRKLLLRLVPLAAAMLLAAAGCVTPTATPPPGAEATVAATAQPTPAAATPTPTPKPTPGAAATPTARATPASTPAQPTALPTELFLKVTEPADESVVAQASVVVRGMTTPDATVSIGGKTAEVDAQGGFAAEVTLVAGPNIIELVASDLAGNQKSALLSLIYVP